MLGTECQDCSVEAFKARASVTTKKNVFFGEVLNFEYMLCMYQVQGELQKVRGSTSKDVLTQHLRATRKVVVEFRQGSEHRGRMEGKREKQKKGVDKVTFNVMILKFDLFNKDA